MDDGFTKFDSKKSRAILPLPQILEAFKCNGKRASLHIEQNLLYCSYGNCGDVM